MSEARFEHLAMVCQHQRPSDSPKGCCRSKGSAELLDRLKERSAQAGQKGRVRITGSGCLGLCKQGVTMVVFSRQQGETWYGSLEPQDADRIFEEHLVGGQPVDDRRAKTRPVR